MLQYEHTCFCFSVQCEQISAILHTVWTTLRLFCEQCEQAKVCMHLVYSVNRPPCLSADSVNRPLYIFMNSVNKPLHGWVLIRGKFAVRFFQTVLSAIRRWVYQTCHIYSTSLHPRGLENKPTETWKRLQVEQVKQKWNVQRCMIWFEPISRFG